ncbi:MAG: Asp/Glu racemase, partial [Pseudomonadota bacterium]
MTEMIENLPFAEADGIGARAAIGLICLASDYTIEQEFREVFARLDPSIAFYQARIANDPVITPESLAAMGPRLTETAGRILP